MSLGIALIQTVAGGIGQPFPTDVDRVTGVTVTADATPHTMGTWTQLIASTSAASQWVTLNVSGTGVSGTDTRTLLDIGVGAAATESAIVSSIPVGSQLLGTSSSTMTIRLPVAIAAGSRVSARIQSIVSAETASVSLATAAQSGLLVPSSLITIGDDRANSRGTNMPTNDTYVQLTASTAAAYQALILLPAGAGATFAAQTSTYTLASGGAGSETALATMAVVTTTAEAMYLQAATGTAMYFGNVPAGTRLAAKQSTGQTYRDAILFAVPYP